MMVPTVKIRGLVWPMLLCAMMASSALPAKADGEAVPDIPNAEDLIKHCWDISLEKRSSGNTPLMREGNLDTALCLEHEIIAHASALLTPPPNEADIIKTMETLRFTYGRFYWDMFNGNRGCNPFCGTENHIRHNWELAKLYEKILSDIIELRNKYGV